jgi:hypothetical protein
MVMLVASACGGSGVHAQTGPVPSDPTSTGSSPTVQTEQQRAGAAAVAQVVKYERTLSELAIHPAMSLNEMYIVSTQPDVTDEIAFLNHFRSAHDRQRGLPQVVSTKVDSVELASASGTKASHPTVRVTACINVSGVQAFGPNGKSIVPKSRKPYYVTHFVLVNFKYPDAQAWLVENVSSTEEVSCSA